MARTPEDLELHNLTADSGDDAHDSLPRYARQAHDYELSFKHPNLTGYRALVLTLTSALGIPKAISMLKNNSKSGSGAVTSLDLAFGVLCVTALYWLGLYEESHPPWMRRWLFNSNIPAVGRDTEEWHHPQLTGYRIIVLFLTAVFGIWKAALMYKGLNFAPNMFDWAFGVICIIGLFWLGWYEKNHPPWLRWIFADKHRARRREQWDHPKLTGYRMLVITVTSSFGISKIILAVDGKSIEATWVDLALGVFWTSTLFWLGLYQGRHSASCPWFFEKGYFSELMMVPFVCAWICGIICYVLLLLALCLFFFVIFEMVVWAIATLLTLAWACLLYLALRVFGHI